MKKTPPYLTHQSRPYELGGHPQPSEHILQQVKMMTEVLQISKTTPKCTREQLSNKMTIEMENESRKNLSLNLLSETKKPVKLSLQRNAKQKGS